MKGLPRSFKFPKRENLTEKKEIEELFRNGSSFYFPPILVKYQLEKNPDIPHHRTLFSVSKKKFRRAVDRNLIKRRMREAYRLNKNRIEANEKAYLQLAFVFIGKSISSYEVVSSKLIAILDRLDKRVLNQGDNLAHNEKD